MSDARLDLAVNLVRQAGEYVRDAFGRGGGFEKEPGHLQVPVDLKADTFIRRELQHSFPHDALLMEESGSHPGSSGYLWVVDPADGSNNLRMGLPYASSAIAVVHEEETLVAAVFNPFTGEIFVAQKGGGAFRNGERICVRSSRSDPLEGFYLQGYRTPPEVQNEIHAALSTISRRVLNLWCPTLDWCNVACGRADYIVGYATEVEDFVQGRLVLEEAGGCLTSWNGGPVRVILRHGERVTFVASNRAARDAVLGAVASARKTCR